MRSHRRSASSRLWVASTIVRPAPAQRLDRLADDERGLGVERRGRLVEEHHRRVVQQRPGDGELLLHALAERAGRRRRAGPTGRRAAGSARSARRATAASQAVQPAEEVEVGGRRQLVVQPGRLGQDADPARGPRRAPRGRRTRRPSAVPSVGSISAVSIRTVVVLPAPFGPSRPSTSPGGPSRSMSRTAQRSPNRRPRPSRAGRPVAGGRPV